MKVSLAERKHLKELLARPIESVGVVSRTSDGSLRFDETKPLRRSGSSRTFHTHNLADKRGGFDPPSRKDMTYLFTFGKAGHYVVSHRGIYYVKISCKVSRVAAKRLISTMGDLQSRLKPGARYNARYMQEVNQLAPSCVKVTFTPWAKMSKVD